MKSDTEDEDTAVFTCHCQKAVLKMSAVSIKRCVKVSFKMKFKLCVCIIKLKLKITVSNNDSNASHCKFT